MIDVMELNNYRIMTEAHQLLEYWNKLLERSRLTTETMALAIPAKKRRRIKSSSLNFINLFDISESRYQSRRFMVHLLAMKLLLQTYLQNRVSSMRELFYRDVAAFGYDQNVLNEALLNMSFVTNGGVPEDFRVFPSSKGLIYGGPLIQCSEGSCQKFELKYESDAILVPNFHNHLKIDTKIESIILFEKDSIFKTYCAHVKNNHLMLRGRHVFLTAKGFPDRLSMKLLKAFVTEQTEVPIYAFVDSDVYGVNIFRTYERGLGEASINLKYTGVFLLDYKEGWQTISSREVILMISLLRQLTLPNPPDSRIAYESHLLMKQELSRGLLLFKKAEMNAKENFSKCERTLLTYLDERVLRVK